MLGAFGDKPLPTEPLMLLAGVLELGGGLLVALGLFTSVAAFLLSGTMAFAYFMAHAPQGFWPIVNKGELAVLYCFILLYFAAHGSGKWSLDRALSGSKSGVKAPTPRALDRWENEGGSLPPEA